MQQKKSILGLNPSNGQVKGSPWRGSTRVFMGVGEGVKKLLYTSSENPSPLALATVHDSITCRHPMEVNKCKQGAPSLCNPVQEKILEDDDKKNGKNDPEEMKMNVCFLLLTYYLPSQHWPLISTSHYSLNYNQYLIVEHPVSIGLNFYFYFLKNYFVTKMQNIQNVQNSALCNKFLHN